MDAASSMSQHPMFILAMKNNLIQHLPYFNLHHHSRTHNNNHNNNNNNINYNRVTDNLCYSWWFFLLFLILIITTESSSTTLTTTATSTTLTCSPRQIKTLQFEDAGAKAHISQVVFKGLVKSRTAIDQQGLYEASFLILQPLKGFPPITKKKRRRVQFASGNSASCKQGVITSNLDINVTYLVFADRAGGHQLRALASPLPATRRHEEAVERSLNSSCVRAPSVQVQRDVQVKEKDRLRLVCKFDGVPLPHIEWYRKGRRVEPTSKRARIRITTKRRRSTLAIHKVSPNDAGKYECRAISATDEKACTSTHVTVTAAMEPPHTGATNNDNATTLWPLVDAPCPISSYCLNGGTCRYYEAVGELVCECAEGYKGQRCESKDVYNRGKRRRTSCCGAPLRREGGGAERGSRRHHGGAAGCSCAPRRHRGAETDWLQTRSWSNRRRQSSAASWGRVS